MDAIQTYSETFISLHMRVFIINAICVIFVCISIVIALKPLIMPILSMNFTNQLNQSESCKDAPSKVVLKYKRRHDENKCKEEKEANKKNMVTKRFSCHVATWNIDFTYIIIILCTFKQCYVISLALSRQLLFFSLFSLLCFSFILLFVFYALILLRRHKTPNNRSPFSQRCAWNTKKK